MNSGFTIASFLGGGYASVFLALIPVLPSPICFLLLSKVTLEKMGRRKIKQAFNEKTGSKRTAVTTKNSLETGLG